MKFLSLVILLITFTASANYPVLRASGGLREYDTGIAYIGNEIIFKDFDFYKVLTPFVSTNLATDRTNGLIEKMVDPNDYLVGITSNVQQQFNILDGRVTQNESDISNNSNAIAINASDIASNAGDIAANQSNIATNTGNITQNSNNITSNDTELADHETRITQNRTDINSNDVELAQNRIDINSNDVELAQNRTDIDSNDVELADHETRVTNLEIDKDYEFITYSTLGPHTAVDNTIHLVAINDAVIDLPAVSLGLEVVIKNTGAFTGITVNSADLMDGSATITIFSKFQSVKLVSDGTTWHRI